MAAESLALLRSICASMKNANDSKEQWLALQMLCPEALQGASEILEQKAIVRIVAKDSRRAFHVIDSASRGKSHTCLPGFCTCMAYCMTVASKPESLVCKHELAILLADALGITEDSVKEEAEFARELDHRTTLPMTLYETQQ